MLFSRPFQDISAADVEQLCDIQYPESEQVEYKEYVPGRDKPDQWHTDQTKGIAEYGRDKLLAEIISFANTHGGHLIIGIEESDDKPKRAVGIKRVPSCVDLADRLRQAAFANIEPRLGNLQIKGITTNGDGSGTIVVRIPQSPAAPHRLMSKQSETARHCYVRRGDSTEALTMREIQDLTLNAMRGFDAVERKLATFRSQFERAAAVNEPVAGFNVIGVRCSAVPLQDMLLNRKQLNDVIAKSKRRFAVKFKSGEQDSIQIPSHGYNIRPVLRGTTIHNRSDGHSYEHMFVLNGSQSITFTAKGSMDDRGEPTKPTLIYLTWVLGVAGSMLHSLQATALESQSPAAEFAVELQLTSQTDHITIRLGEWKGRTEYEGAQIVLPQYSFVPEAGIEPLMDQILADLMNTLGYDYSDSIVSVKIE